MDIDALEKELKAARAREQRLQETIKQQLQDLLAAFPEGADALEKR